MKPVLVLLPVLGLTWLVGMLVHLGPAWAYAAVGLNSFQVPPGLGRLGLGLRHWDFVRRRGRGVGTKPQIKEQAIRRWCGPFDSRGSGGPERGS